MTFNFQPSIEKFIKIKAAFAKKEYYTNRKQHESWKAIKTYPMPSKQIMAWRIIAPNGYQTKWTDGEINTFIPAKRDEMFYFKLK